MINVTGATAETHDCLNPKIWTSDNRLRTDVKQKLNEIIEEFVSFVDFDIRILDAHIVGSNASYNYTPYSDLDLHLIVNYDEFDASNQLVEMLMWSQKKLFNDEYDLSIRGVNVEVYVEDVRSVTVSNGIYSLFSDKWLKLPEVTSVEIDEELVDTFVEELLPDIEFALNSNIIEYVQQAIDTLYIIRKNGLSTEGEYSVGNLAFKEFRNLGYLSKLKDKLVKLKSAELSISGAKLT